MKTSKVCNRCGATGLFWDMNSVGRWQLFSTDSNINRVPHKCEGGELKIVSCKYCNKGDLHWSKETLENNQVVNALCESYGLPHDCEERKIFKQKEWEEKKAAKRQQYAAEKTRLDEMVKANRISQKQANFHLYKYRMALWPRLGQKKTDVS